MLTNISAKNEASTDSYELVDAFLPEEKPGCLLQIKSILKFKNQTFEAIAKVRTLAKAKEYMYRLLDADTLQGGIRDITHELCSCCMNLVL